MDTNILPTCSSLPQVLCTSWLLCLEYSSQISEWQVPPHLDFSSNMISLKGLISHPTSCFFFLVFCYHITFSAFLYKAGHSVKLHYLFIYFLVHFCFPNGKYNAHAVTRNLSSLFTTVAPKPRTIPGTQWTINNYSRQRFMKLHGSLKETCFEADYKIACNIRRQNGI